MLALVPILIKIGKYLIYMIPVIIVVVLLWMLYSDGYHKGEKHTQSLWDKDKLEYSQQIQKLQSEYQAKEQEHQKESLLINEKLSSLEQNHEKAIATIKSDYASSLQQSEQRAEVYKRQASSGTIGCQRLAGYATQFDRSIEQGRSLVREFSETLKQRDEQIIQLSNQIKSDRKLIGDNEVNNEPR